LRLNLSGFSLIFICEKNYLFKEKRCSTISANISFKFADRLFSALFPSLQAVVIHTKKSVFLMRQSVVFDSKADYFRSFFAAESVLRNYIMLL